jgi:hypothetical protein
MQAELVAADSPRWADVLSGMRHDFYHLPSYVSFAARRQDAGAPMAFIADDGGHRFLAPMIVRPISLDLSGDRPLFDATCPRGYPGPLVELEPGREAGSFADRAIHAFVETLRERSIVTVFSRLHPLMMPPMPSLLRGGQVVEHGDSVSVDLALPLRELWRQTRSSHRQDINRAEGLGYRARIDETWQRFDAFVDAYGQSMDRLGAVAFWRLSREYFQDLKETLGDHAYLCVVELGDDLAAAGILTETDGIVEYHSSGTANAFVSASPSKVLVNFARGWAKQRGNRVLHLTGSLRKGDTLYQFKTGFSPLNHPVCSWRVVTDPPWYGTLVARWESRHAAPADPADGYFPAYRKPGLPQNGRSP